MDQWTAAPLCRQMDIQEVVRRLENLWKLSEKESKQAMYHLLKIHNCTVTCVLTRTRQHSITYIVGSKDLRLLRLDIGRYRYRYIEIKLCCNSNFFTMHSYTLKSKVSNEAPLLLRVGLFCVEAYCFY